MSGGRYCRVVLFMGNEMMRPLDDDDAETLMGSEVVVRMSDTVVAAGVVTSAKVIDNGQRLQVVIENNGRSCAACGNVWTDGDAAAELVPLRQVYTGPPLRENKIYRHIPLWTAVCRDPVACRRRCAKAPS